MDDDSVTAQEAVPETIEAPKGEETEGQAEGLAAEGQPEEKSESAKRREREKAYRARLQTEAAEAKAEAEQAKARKAAILEAGKKDAAPQESDFPDPIEFAAAKAIWGAEQRYREREANGAGEVAEAAERKAKEIEATEAKVIDREFQGQLDDARKRYADFDAVALSDDVPVTPQMAQLIKTSDQGADVAYFLGQNRALAAQIAALNPVEAARAIGRIEASLTAPKPRTETNAPPPINPVRGSAGATRNPDKMSYTEWVKWREGGGKVT